MSDMWCVDCACWLADHNADGTCGACGDCFHPRFVPVTSDE